MIELTNEVKQQKRISMRAFIFCLVLVVLGYWITTYAIIVYHSAIRTAVQYAIRHDIAQTEIRPTINDGRIATVDARVLYTTAVALDECRSRIEDVRLSIIDLPLGGPERVNVASR